jgi:Lipocalin-like domain
LIEYRGNATEVVGTWLLVAVETILPNGEISTAWLGKEPIGIIMYLPNGLVAVQIMRDPKPTFSSGSRLLATPDEIKGAYFGYYAYWGTYTVNPSDKTITHQLTASLWPEEVGITYKRSYTFDRQRLVLTTPTFKHDGQEVRNQLTWERPKE